MSLAERLPAFETHLLAKGLCAHYVARTIRICHRILAEGRTEDPALLPGACEGIVVNQRLRKVCDRTTKISLTAFRAFVRWAGKQGFLPRELYLDIPVPHAFDDCRRQRRALTDAEIKKLLAITEISKRPSPIPGPVRSLCYRLVVETGLRACEVRSLTPESFLYGSNPRVTVRPLVSKRRTLDVLPLRLDTAARIEALAGTMQSGERMFGIPCNAARMLRPDLVEAGIEPKDTDGRVVDFHALRHTFITRLVLTPGVSVRQAQELARHSSAEMTMKVYAHITLADSRRAIDSMAPI